MDFNDVMEILNRVPTNEEMGVYLYLLNDWFAARTLTLIPAFTALGVVVYKTPWNWDNRLYEKIKIKLGIGAKNV